MKVPEVSMERYGEVIERKHDSTPPSAETRGDAAPRPVRLMKVVQNFGRGGTEGQVNSLLRGLDSRRYQVSFACTHRWGPHLSEIEQWRMPIREFPVRSLYKPHTLRMQLQLAREMRRQRIDVVHSYNFYANTFALPAARLAGVPLVIASIRDQGVYLTRAQRLAQRWVCRLADRILVNADSIRHWLAEEGLPEEKILTIRNGIDVDRFRKPPKSTIREEFNLAPDEPLVVMLARLNPQKGVDDFLRAAAQVSQRHPRVRFLLVGERLRIRDGEILPDTDYQAELSRLCERLDLGDRLIFTGARTDVPGLLAEAAISVLPSHSEGISNSLLESMAAGLPIVATRVGGIPELVEDGVNGYLVPPRQPEEVAAAINRLLDDPALARRFSEAARQRAEQHFSLEKMVSDTEALYRRELAAKGWR